jgi:serine/threonine-protein kinase RsbW
LSDRPLDIDLQVAARADNVAVVRRALAGLAEAGGATDDTAGDIKTAVTEACMNAVVHAYPNGDGGTLEVSAGIDDVGRLTICIRDHGTGIQPRPLQADTDPSGMHIGLPLIGALADEFEISGGPGRGTLVRIVFDLVRRARGEAAPSTASGEAALADAETVLTVSSDRDGHSAIGPVLTMLAARERFSVDRLADLQLLGDLLSDFTAGSSDPEPLRIAIVEGEGELELAIGPLEEGTATRIVDRGDMPGLGNALERITDRINVQRADLDASGGAEYLRLQVSG